MENLLLTTRENLLTQSMHKHNISQVPINQYKQATSSARNDNKPKYASRSSISRIKFQRTLKTSFRVRCHPIEEWHKTKGFTGKAM